MRLKFFGALFAYILCNLPITSAIQCMDDNNEAVDWFAAYKIPRIKHANKLIADGVGYVYVTSKKYSEWIFSPNSINQSESILGNTLKRFYKENISYIFYNDQPPNEPIKSGKGHTKGAILSDSEGGFWLIHSVPHFLPLSSEYSFSKTGTAKGQSFLCISLDLKNLNKVGIQLQYNEPQIYASYISETLQIKLSELVSAASGKVTSEPPWYNEVVITSKEGIRFRSFAKARKFGKDLYHDWVAPALGTDLLVETWLNGPGRLPSNCANRFRVYNVESVGVKAADIIFKASDDHSKWAVSVHDPWICIGDINRMEHQKFRGGGTTCLNNEQLTDIYRKSVATTEKCSTSF